MLKKLFVLLFAFHTVVFASDWLTDQNINQALKILDSNQSIDELPDLKNLLIKLQPLVNSTHVKRKKIVEKEFELVKNKLIENDIPPILAYITFAESNFHPKVKGHGTAGLWQFTKQSAKILGLKVSKKRDDRLDINKSTNAAIKQLKRLKSKYKSLYLADFAYGLGEGTLAKIIASSKDDSIKSIWKNRSFKYGTKAHFAKIILLYCAIDATSNTEELIQTGTEIAPQETPSSDVATTINQSVDLLKNP